MNVIPKTLHELRKLPDKRILQSLLNVCTVCNLLSSLGLDEKGEFTLTASKVYVVNDFVGFGPKHWKLMTK